MARAPASGVIGGQRLCRRDFLGVVGVAGAAAIAEACGAGARGVTVASTTVSGSISGQVTDLQGVPQPSLGTLILMYGHGQQVGMRATPDVNGRFTFAQVAPGSYQVRFDAPHKAIIPDPFENPIRFDVAAAKDTFVPVRVQLGDYTQNLVEIYIGEGFFQQQPDGLENADVVVSVGTNLCWYNVDTQVHTVTGGPWGDSGDLQESQAYFWTATQAGSFGYRCKYHQPQEQAMLRVSA
jgi:hypothetical protein